MNKNGHCIGCGSIVCEAENDINTDGSCPCTPCVVKPMCDDAKVCDEWSDWYDSKYPEQGDRKC